MYAIPSLSPGQFTETRQKPGIEGERNYPEDRMPQQNLNLKMGILFQT
jgi:hypothetical protein